MVLFVSLLLVLLSAFNQSLPVAQGNGFPDSRTRCHPLSELKHFDFQILRFRRIQAVYTHKLALFQ